MTSVRIGILGDFNPEFRSHHATPDSLQHAAHKLDLKVESEWIPTPSLIGTDAEKTLESFDGLWAAPGSPYKSFDGMLKGIEFARRRDWPFLGTCGGFQYVLIEFARNVLGIADADSVENNSGSKNIVIYPVACAVPNRKGDAPKLSGVVPEIRLRPGSYLQSFYGKKEIVTEEFFCNFEVNPEYEWCAMEAGFPRRRSRIARRNSRHRISCTPLLHRNPVSAPALLDRKKSPSTGHGLRTGRSRLDPSKTRRRSPRVVPVVKEPLE